jgi:apolipoprotein N-acyltransferase
VIAILCALASGLAFLLGHGTADVSALAWVAPVPVLWLAFRRERAWRVAMAAVGAYALGGAGSLWPYFHVIGPVLVVAMALVSAVVFAAIVMAVRHASHRLPTGAAVLVFPTLWTAWEGLSATYSPHGTFGAWAYSQVGVPIMIQSASLLGLWVITFLIALFAAAAAMSMQRRIAGPFVAAAALVIVNVTFGAWRLHQSEGITIRVAASAIGHDDHTSPDQVAIQQAAEVERDARAGAELVVFQEKAALLPASRRDVVLAPLVAAAKETGVTIVTGFDQTGAERRNAAYAITGDGPVRTYTKRHHIPGLESGYIIGNGPGLLGNGRAVAICKDFDFQSTLRHDVAAAESRGGLEVMAAPAWDFDADGWLHARMAVLRGVEGGYAVVRAAGNGLLTVSDSRGRLRARSASGVGRYASIVVDVPRGPGTTPYAHVGDVFVWLTGGVGLGLLLWSVRVRPGPGSDTNI